MKNLLLILLSIYKQLKLYIKLELTKVNYKYGSFLSIVPPHFYKQKGLQIGKNVVFHKWNVTIGNYCFIGNNTFFDHCDSIGNFCSVSHNVQIGLVNHALDHVSTSPFLYKKEKKWIKESTHIEREASSKVVIENDVLISANVIVLEGVNIGNGAVIGAGAVVTKDVPAYAIVAGVPATIVKYRFDKSTINKLLKSQWWNLPKEELLKYKDSFNNPKIFFTDTVNK